MASDALFERARIEELLPHRPPFLFVDRVVEHDGDRLTAEWDVPPDLPAFAGHFPGDPVLPGVLISEFCFQAGALLIFASSSGDGDTRGIPVLTRIEDARFKKIVRPGETLRADVALEDRLGAARYLSAKVTSAGQTVARLRCVLAVASPESADEPRRP